MQLYALNNEDTLVFAAHALKHHDYFCIECHQVVRSRGGEHRQIHYYHLSPSLSCRLNGKSMTHLQVQFRLQKILPLGEGQLEYRFPSINRIADVVWLPQKLIFEIQCSAITAEEVRSRNEDYKSLGFQVIWILHDNRFNQRRLTAAEKYLDAHPHYFTNIDREGVGIIYDQFTLVCKGMRSKILNPLPVDLAKPTRLPRNTMSWIVPLERALPKVVMQRGIFWKIFFFGDLLEQSMLSPINPDFTDYLDQAIEREREEEEKFNISQPNTGFDTVKSLFSMWIARPFSLIFQIILEKACK